jgi:hypothetical protein
LFFLNGRTKKQNVPNPGPKPHVIGLDRKEVKMTDNETSYKPILEVLREIRLELEYIAETPMMGLRLDGAEKR